MRLLLAAARSAMETLPLCLMNLATASNSDVERKMNFPRSSNTPVKILSSCSFSILLMAAWIFSLNLTAKSSKMTTFLSYNHTKIKEWNKQSKKFARTLM